MANDLGLLADNCYEKFYIEPVVIGDEEVGNRTMQQVKIKQGLDRIYRDIDGVTFEYVDGIKTRFYYGFSGDSSLFTYRASTRLSHYPQIEISSGFIVFEYADPLYDTKNPEYKSNMLAQLQHDLDLIQRGIGYVNNDVVQYNDRLRETALHSLEERKKKIEQFYALSKAFEIQLKKSEFAKTHIPTNRRISPTAKNYDNSPNYYISDAEYQDILSAIKPKSRITYTQINTVE